MGISEGNHHSGEQPFLRNMTVFGNRKSHHAPGIRSFREAPKAFVCVFAFSSPFSMFILQASLFPTQTFQMLQNSLNHCHHYHWNSWKFISGVYSLTLRRLSSGHDSVWKPNICFLRIKDSLMIHQPLKP